MQGRLKMKLEYSYHVQISNRWFMGVSIFMKDQVLLFTGNPFCNFVCPLYMCFYSPDSRTLQAYTERLLGELRTVFGDFKMFLHNQRKKQNSREVVCCFGGRQVPQISSLPGMVKQNNATGVIHPMSP